MPGSVSPTLPVIGNPNSSEDPHTRSSLVTLRDALNDILTSGNLVDGAQIGIGSVPNAALAGNIQLAKLADGANKQIIVCDISGVPTYVDMTGDVTIGNAGGTTIANLAVSTAKIAANAVTSPKLSLTVLSDVLATTDTALPASWTNYCTATPVANATYLVMGQVGVHRTTSGASVGNVNVRLLVDGAASVTIDEYYVPSDGSEVTVSIQKVVTPTTTNALSLQAQNEGAAALTVRANQTTRLTAVRIG